MWLFITPSDVWLFRDGRPFDAGADHRARSLFPPNPTTLQGALRSKALALYGVDLAAYRGRDVDAAVAAQIGRPPQIEWRRGQPVVVEEGDFGRLRLRGPFVARRASGQVTPYFPCPADALVEKRVDKGPDVVAQLRVTRQVVFEANWPKQQDAALQPLMYDAVVPVEESRAWLSAPALSRYLNGENLEPEDLTEQAKLFTDESRFGVGIDSAVKRPQEGLLYQVEYVRPADNVGLLVEVTGLDEAPWGQRGVLSFGGEARAAQYEVLTAAPPLPTSPMDSERFKVYLATPAWFEQGWRPQRWSAFFTPEPTLVASAVRRYQAIGGWDIAHNRQKPMRRYVPAGSVYYFEGQAQATGSLLCDAPTDSQIGFGQYFTGRW